MKSLPTALALISAGTLCGCARMTPGLGFDRVQSEVAHRTGARTQWNRGGTEDHEAAKAIDELLAAELTADSAVQVALLNNRDLAATYEDLDIAQADLVRAGLLKNPIFSGEFRFDTRGGGTGVVLDVTQDFLSILTMSLRKSWAGAGFESAQARASGAAVRTAFQTREAFIDFQAAQDSLELRKTVAQSTEASYELARKLFEAGNIRELDLLNEESLYRASSIEIETARGEVELARERLNDLLGVWGPQTHWHAAARLPALPSQDASMEDLERRAVASSLELAENKALVDQAAVAARLARPLAWLEGSDIGVASEREVEGGWSVGPSFSIPIPIFDTAGAASGEAAARLRQAAAHYYAAAVRARASARAAAAQLHSARARALQYSTVILPLHQRIVEQAQLQYNAMQISAFALLQAKREQIEAGVGSIEALRDYWKARAGVEQAAGSMNIDNGASHEHQ